MFRAFKLLIKSGGITDTQFIHHYDEQIYLILAKN